MNDVSWSRQEDTPDVAGATARIRAGIRGSRLETTQLVDAVLHGQVDLDQFGAWLLAFFF